MTTVSQLLRSKGHAAWSISPAATVFDALVLMAEKDVGALLVLEQDKLVGIVSERDVARKTIIKGKLTEKTAVRDVMTQDVVSVKPDDTVEHCMTIMTNKHFRHLPVISENMLIGVISIGDVVKAQISEQEAVIGDLKRYISGSRA